MPYSTIILADVNRNERTREISDCLGSSHTPTLLFPLISHNHQQQHTNPGSCCFANTFLFPLFLSSKYRDEGEDQGENRDEDADDLIIRNVVLFVVVPFRFTTHLERK